VDRSGALAFDHPTLQQIQPLHLIRHRQHTQRSSTRVVASTPIAKPKLGAFLMATGHHIAAWRHPDVPADAGLDFSHYKHLAQIAEAAKFYALFIADSVAAATRPIANRMARSDHFEPLTLLATLSAVTERIGLIATPTASYNEPYHVARKFASMDSLSGGDRAEILSLSTMSPKRKISVATGISVMPTATEGLGSSIRWSPDSGVVGKMTPLYATRPAVRTTTRKSTHPRPCRRTLPGQRPAEYAGWFYRTSP